MHVEYISALKDVIAELMIKERTAVLMGMSITNGGIFGESEGLAGKVNKKRIIDTPYSIDTVLGSALGLAMSGAKPIVFVKGEYLLKGADVLAGKIAVNDYITNGSFDSDVLIISELDISGEKGAETVAAYESVFAQMSGIDVMCIANAGDVKRMITSAYYNKKPTIVFICTQNINDISVENEDEYVMGSAQVLCEGDDVTVITYGQAVNKTLAAAAKAESMGVNCEVIDLVCLSDIDTEAITKSVEKTGKVLIVQDARKNLGMASEVAARIVESEAFFFLEEKIVRLCGKDEIIPYSKELFKDFVPGKEEIVNAILTLQQ